MRRTYNLNISERANICLEKREAQVRRQKCVIVIVVLAMIVFGILFGGSIHVFAGESQTQKLHKYYTSIRIEEGDTLWDIAGEYVQNTKMSRQEYINEVCALNGICADEIYAGEYIVVMYYEVEK